MSDRIEYYRDKAGEWRWRYVAANNRIMATSGEGYFNREDCLDAAEQVTALPGTLPMIEVSE